MLTLYCTKLSAYPFNPKIKKLQFKVYFQPQGTFYQENQAIDQDFPKAGAKNWPC